MFQLLVKNIDPKTRKLSWSCLAVRPKIGQEPVMEDELIDALVDALDERENPVAAIIEARGELGEMYLNESEVYCVFLDTLTNVFVPLAVLPKDDAYLVASEMSESVANKEGAIVVLPVPSDVNYPKLAYTLATERSMLKWWS